MKQQDFRVYLVRWANGGFYWSDGLVDGVPCPMVNERRPGNITIGTDGVTPGVEMKGLLDDVILFNSPECYHLAEVPGLSCP